MTLLDHVVVGVDDSEGAQRALAWAVAQAPAGEVNVVHGFSPGLELLAAAIQINLDPMRAEHQRLLENDWVAAVVNKTTKVTTELVDDNPASALLAAAARHKSIPIVIGQQRDRQWSPHHVGDVASRLLHMAEVPLVMTSATTSAQPVTGAVAVCVYGPADQADPALQWAVQFATERSLALRVINSAEPLMVGPGRGYPVDVYQADMAARLEAHRTALDALLAALGEAHGGLDLDGTVLGGHPTLELAEAINNDSSLGLVVLGNHHHTKLGSFFTGGVARHLPPLIESQSPVVAVPVR